MNDNKLISVIIPVYNCEKYFHNSLESILLQTYKNFELIIINDASTDNTKSIIKEFININSNLNIKYFENTDNKGQAASLNIGLENAFGEYICIIDSDDKVSPDFLFILKEKIQNFYDFVYCGFDMIDIINNKTIKYEENRKYLSESNDIIKQYMNATNHFTFVGAIYNTEFLLKHNIRFNEANRYGCDIEFICELFLKKPNCGCVNKSLYYYIIRPDSLSTETECPNILHCVEAMQRIQKKIPYIKDRIMFSMTKKANMIYHVITDLFQKKVKKEITIIKKIYFATFFLIQIAQNPRKRFTKYNLKALILFLK